MQIAIDTETYLIKGANVPPFVCLSYAECEGNTWESGVMRGNDAYEYLRSAFARHEIIMHNARFDLLVIARAWPSLLPLIFTALEDNRVHDTGIREKLHKIASGGSGDGMIFREDESGNAVKVAAKLSLAGLVYKYYGVDISAAKKGDVRRSYDDLDDQPLETWGAEAIEYATQDAILTGLVYFAQCVGIESDELRDETAQVRADFALGLLSTEGIRVDEGAVAGVREALEAEIDKLRAPLRRAGILNPRGKANTAFIKDRVDELLCSRGIEVPKTASGAVSTGKDALKLTEDPDLLTYLRYKEAQKLLSTYVGALESAPSYGGIIRPEYKVLMKTGRTSCKGPNLQNLPRSGGVRDCYVPRDGSVFILCDYDAAEMRTLAQCYLDIVGKHSPLGEMYARDPKFDPHSYLGAQLLDITYEEMLERVARGDKQAKSMRQRAKPANFGYAGGMGAGAFIDYARSYGVDLTTEEAEELRETWISTYEMKPWFRAADRAVERGSVECPRSGRFRGRPAYTEACNMPFQGMAADGAKQALFEVARECWSDPDSPLFGARPVAFIHDEIIVDVREDQAHDAAMRVKEIMESAMNKATPDVPSSASPALATRWLKGADPKYDDVGRLIPWA